MKDFDSWNEIKKKTESEERRLYKVREIWWCQFGLNIGTEQDGRGGLFLRPCLILRGFGPDACFVIPLTTSKRNHYLRISVGIINNKEAKANLSQVRVIDTRRLVEKIEFLNQETFEKIRKIFKDIL